MDCTDTLSHLLVSLTVFPFLILIRYSFYLFLDTAHEGLSVSKPQLIFPGATGLLLQRKGLVLGEKPVDRIASSSGEYSVIAMITAVKVAVPFL